MYTCQNKVKAKCSEMFPSRFSDFLKKAMQTLLIHKHYKRYDTITKTTPFKSYTCAKHVDPAAARIRELKHATGMLASV